MHPCPSSQSLMGLKPGQWKLKIWKVWRRQNVGMMVRWMCGVSLMDRKHSEDLCSLLGIQWVADVVGHGRLRWFEHLEHESGDDWVLSCRNMEEVVEVTCVGRGRKTWGECVKDDMKLLGLQPDMWRDLIWGKRLTLI